jgi:hypothetical protein
MALGIVFTKIALSEISDVGFSISDLIAKGFKIATVSFNRKAYHLK